jgi:transcriptional regulator with XRE-family HTH domain
MAGPHRPPYRFGMTTASVPSFGEQLRAWRQRRRISQLDLALDAEISTRHLSFVETGRSRPSREMVMRLAEQLGVPLRERNALLVAAGYAPVFRERSLDDPALGVVKDAVQRLLAAHEPFPALAIDRRWTMVAANAAIGRLVAGADPALLEPPVNVLRLSLHPKGLAPRIANLPEWRRHLLQRLKRDAEATADPVLMALQDELRDYPVAGALRDRRSAAGAEGGVVVPLSLVTDAGILNLISTTTVFGTAAEVTPAELAVETFFPADAAAGAILARLAGADAAPNPTDSAGGATLS